MQTLSFKQFRDGARAVANLAEHEGETSYAVSDWHDAGEIVPGRIYEGGLVIEGPRAAGDFYLCEGSFEIISPDLESLEAMLYVRAFFLRWPTQVSGEAKS